MTNNSSNQGYVALYVARNALGTAEQISFLNRDAGYGRLCDATVYTAPGPQLGPEQHWTALPDVLPTLLAILKDRGDLAIVADFQDLELDEDDLPAVLLHSCTCRACGHQWQDMLGRPATTAACPRCRATVEIVPQMIQWAGPRHPIMHQLWQLLPSPAETSHPAPGGLRTAPLKEGLVITDPAGNQVAIRRGAGGLDIALFPAHGRSRAFGLTQTGVTDRGPAA